jgi:hypothetical protein
MPAFISGPIRTCSQCKGEAFELAWETFDEQDRCYVGKVTCRGCRTVFLYTRRPGQRRPPYVIIPPPPRLD